MAAAPTDWPPGGCRVTGLDATHCSWTSPVATPPPAVSTAKARERNLLLRAQSDNEALCRVGALVTGGVVAGPEGGRRGRLQGQLEG